MSLTTTSEGSAFQEAATYGGVVDAIGGVATIILAIVGLSGISQMMLTSIATIIFGAALLIQGGTMLTEFTKLMASPSVAPGRAEEVVGAGGLSALFLVGAAGIVLGVLSLIGIASHMLTAVAIIAFGSALLLSSNSVWHLYRAKQASYRAGGARTHSRAEYFAGEMASGSAVLQFLAGLAVIVLGILAVIGTNASMLTLVGLLVLGATVLLTGSTLSGVVIGFMEPAVTRPGGASPQSSSAAE